jgi:hypothetical protein
LNKKDCMKCFFESVFGGRFWGLNMEGVKEDLGFSLKLMVLGDDFGRDGEKGIYEELMGVRVLFE